VIKKIIEYIKKYSMSGITAILYAEKGNKRIVGNINLLLEPFFFEIL
jgi:hypothetical protein